MMSKLTISRFARGVAAWLLLVTTASCGVARQMLASPADLADYREFRAAAYEGARLARAQRYLERHAGGVWADEVRSAFDAEEPVWFDAAKTSRSRARAYLVDLPAGPHADAARALLVLFDEHKGDVETLELLADARRTSAMLDAESVRRKRVGEVVLEELAVLLDRTTWGARLDAPPPPLASALRGHLQGTWGGATRGSHTEQAFFVVPTPQGAQSRVAEIRFRVWLEGQRVALGAIQGGDLFTRWAEAMEIRELDPGKAADRARIASLVADTLGGALEATLPAARCAAKTVGDEEILSRACDGWSVTARRGGPTGEDDTIEVRGPLPAP
jgi:hypothetical protein